VTTQQLIQITSYCNLITPVHQLSSNSQSARLSFHKSNKCSLSNITWHLVLPWFSSTSSGIYFLILLCQINKKISFLLNHFHAKGTIQWIASNMRKIVNASNAEHSEHLQHLIQHCFLFSNFNVIYLLTNRTCQEWVAWLFNHPVLFPWMC
jgi:hypothetical protein